MVKNHYKSFLRGHILKLFTNGQNTEAFDQFPI